MNISREYARQKRRGGRDKRVGFVGAKDLSSRQGFGSLRAISAGLTVYSPEKFALQVRECPHESASRPQYDLRHNLENRFDRLFH
jgi:hypothetical protein